MNNLFPSKEAVERLREQYPIGSRVELISMDDPYSKLKPGDKGSVTYIDDTGTVFCAWDSGSGLGLVYGADQFKKIEREVTYETGADFWNDLKLTSKSFEDALLVGGRYLETQSKKEQPDDEHQFCRELFTAMYEDSAKTTNPARLVYPYDFQKASGRMEASYYHDSRKQNTACIKAIDAAISSSYYKTNHYNLDIAAMKVIQDFGFERVNMALAKTIQEHDYDGRYSNGNKSWAKGYEVTPKTFDGAYLNSHPVLLDGFTSYTRKLYEELSAERLALPGRTESGEFVHGYEIVRAVEFDSDRGFAIGLNPHAVNQFVCWQFTAENGARDYYWGTYADEFQEAAQNYIARVIVHMSGGDAHEVQKRQAFDYEKNTEQNYNNIDGLRNNEDFPRPDLTDGQTYEEIRELAPETLPENKPPENEAEPVGALNNRPAVNEAELNTAAWLAVTASSRFRWVEDEIVRLNGRGAMYYTGGEDGVYMRIHNDGKLEAGRYEGAIPHIGEAFFHTAVVRQFDSFSDAYKAAMETGGKQFLIDMFSGGERQPLHETARRNTPDEKPSVMKQIRDAQTAPRQPAKDAPELGRKKTGPEL